MHFQRFQNGHGICFEHLRNKNTDKINRIHVECAWNDTRICEPNTKMSGNVQSIKPVESKLITNLSSITEAQGPPWMKLRYCRLWSSTISTCEAILTLKPRKTRTLVYLMFKICFVESVRRIFLIVRRFNFIIWQVGQ